jgi:hypothetical protein
MVTHMDALEAQAEALGVLISGDALSAEDLKTVSEQTGVANIPLEPLPAFNASPRAAPDQAAPKPDAVEVSI